MSNLTIIDKRGEHGKVAIKDTKPGDSFEWDLRLYTRVDDDEDRLAAISWKDQIPSVVFFIHRTNEFVTVLRTTLTIEGAAE